MALFEREETEFGSDVGTRALSVIAVENHFVERVYEKLASVYDVIFGPALHPGRLVARDRMPIEPGSHILEVGVGTGINASLYPQHCQITGIDLSASMEMDAASLTFADDSFDIVYAPYLISVVPDPITVAREMRRVCRPGGKIIILNHFRSANPVLSRLERAISPFTVHIGFKSDLDLPAFLAQAELQPESIEKVNVPKIWSLVTCVK
jgi:phosphatidylethanolamine/phosphatidyl-N-methylethanolamine N-methyltransferase